MQMRPLIYFYTSYTDCINLSLKNQIQYAYNIKKCNIQIAYV